MKFLIQPTNSHNQNMKSNIRTMFSGKLILGMLFATSLFLLSCNPSHREHRGNSHALHTEAFRPQFHFSPDSMWMNDPNGMVYYKGEYHLFYQHHPYSNIWGPMHWGHAVSRDLIHWETLPIALYPDSLGTIFSGSVVIDRNNSSGLGSPENPPMVAIFTHHNQELQRTGSMQFQYQSLAYSLDRGRSWTKYSGNPVVENPGIRDFRDPKVSWYEEGQKWIMVLAAQDRILFYSSPNLIDWDKESEFYATKGLLEGVWECPDFFSLDNGKEKKWVLLISVGAGGPQGGGSGTKYYIGDFDGSRFTCDDPSGVTRWLDWGKDDYAGVTWSGIPSEDGRRIFMGWMSNWQYAMVVPTYRWRSAMTLPRELRLDKDRYGFIVASVPAEETRKLRSARKKLKPVLIEDSISVGPAIKRGYPLYEIDLTFEFGPRTTEESEFGIILGNSLDEQLLLSYHPRNQFISIDRNRSGITGFSQYFPGIHYAPYHAREAGEIRFHVFVDLSSAELFVDQGDLVMTELCFPETGYQTISLYSKGGTVNLKQGEIYQLKRIW